MVTGRRKIRRSSQRFFEGRSGLGFLEGRCGLGFLEGRCGLGERLRVVRFGGPFSIVFCQASVMASPSVSSWTKSSRTLVHPARPQAPFSGANVSGWSWMNCCC